MDLPIRPLTEAEQVQRRVQEFIEQKKFDRVSTVLVKPVREVITLTVFATKIEKE